MVAVILQVSIPDIDKDMVAEHPVGEVPPLPPAPPTGAGFGNNTLPMLLKNEVIELYIDVKKLLMS